MNLHEFIRDVIIELDTAVEEARTETKRDIHFYDTKDQRTVEFDIAVSVESTDSANGKAGITVLHFVEAGGGINSETKNSTVSRIKFGIHIDRKTKSEKNQLEKQY